MYIRYGSAIRRGWPGLLSPLYRLFFFPKDGYTAALGLHYSAHGETTTKTNPWESRTFYAYRCSAGVVRVCRRSGQGVGGGIMESFDTVWMKKRKTRLGKAFKTSRGSEFKAAVLRTQPQRRQRRAWLVRTAGGWGVAGILVGWGLVEGKKLKIMRGDKCG